MKKTISLFLICVLLASSFCSVTAFAEYDTLPFTDLAHGITNGFLNVKHLYEKGIISGKTETKFSYKDPIKREEAAKIMVLAAKAPLSSKKGSFTDVASGSWYEVYIETALQSGLMNGVDSNTFGVGTYITRQDAAVLVSRLAEYIGVTMENYKNITIADLDTVADYAKSSVVSLVNMGIANVDAAGKFEPLTNIQKLDLCKYVDRTLIADIDYYDDYLTDWMPKEIDMENFSSEIVAFENFDNGLTVLDGHEDTIDGTSSAVNSKNFIVKNAGKDNTSCIKFDVSATGRNGTNLYLRGVEPGVQYFFSYDIKTENLPETSFIRINYQWHNANGSVSGMYERNNDLYGVTDWISQTATTTAPSPDMSPTFLRIYLSVRSEEDQGIVYLDNFKIYKVVYDPITTYLKYPAFKGLITEPDGEGDIQLTTFIKGLGSIYNKNDYKVVAEISELEGNRTYAKTEEYNISEEMDITFSSNILPLGDYDLSASLINKATGKVEGVNHWVLRKRDENFTSKYSFDKEGRLLKNGTPTFPIGAYALGLYDDVIADFKDSPIDFYLSNSGGSLWTNNSNFAKLREADVEIMMNTEHLFSDSMRGQYQNTDVTNIASERAVLTRIVDDLNFATEEGFIGYQTNNEFPADKWVSRLTWHYQILNEIDFDHINYGVGVGGKQAGIDYARCHDVYAQDVYPITGADTDEIWQVYDATKGLVDGTIGRPAWAVLQISDLKVMNRAPYTSRERGPNETELRNMAWQAVCAGAQGILWYAHFHLDDERPENEEDVVEGQYYVSRPKSETQPEMMRVSQEVADHSEIILSREDAPDVKLTSTDPSKFAYTTRRYNGKTYVFMVNMSSETQNVSLYLESASSAHGEYSGVDYTIANNGKTDLSLDALGVEILVVDQAERPSPDCELKNVQLFDENNNSYFIVKDGETNNIYLPVGVDTLYYNVSIHPDARVIVNGCPNKTKGSMSLDGKDKIRFTVISEDGQNFEQHWYNIIRK